MAGESYVVIGGEGFLGHALVSALTAAHPSSSVASLDLVQRHHATPSAPLKHSFSAVDLTSVESLVSALENVKATTVFHTASPWIGSSVEVAEKVNVQGTKGVVEACQKTGVKTLVYTSSAGAVFCGQDLIGVDERLPFPDPKRMLEHYNVTKAAAEKIVLEANGKGGVATVAIRPAGIFGPGDRQALPGFIDVLKCGQAKFQLGPNENLFDWTYIDNVVHGHLLAAEKISRKIPFSAFLNRTGPIAKTLTRRRIPTSERNPEEETTETDLPLAVYRNRFDQFAPASLEEAAGENGPEELSVAGSAFFITGGEPIHFWDFAQAIWYEYDGHINTKTSVWVFPKMLALWLASMAMLWAKLMRKPSAFTPEKVLYATSIRWFNIERARIMLDYEPVVGVEEGIKRGVAWYKADEAAKAAAKAQ